MDPNAAFADLLEALRDRDTETAREIFDALASWIDHGGFLPAVLASKES